jgi:hypothetical protein
MAGAGQRLLAALREFLARAPKPPFATGKGASADLQAGA